mmetsp:Transcript_17143/g.32450  ORF Transcript_17143/g.32450 Transcript_17143/m.32450 type:complete len:142 (-) Transcript_17143:2070-2495(-)
MLFSPQLGILIIFGSFFYSVHSFLPRTNPRKGVLTYIHDQPTATFVNRKDGSFEMKTLKKKGTSGLFMDIGKFFSDAFGMDNNDDKGNDGKNSSPKSNNNNFNIQGGAETEHDEGEYGYVGCSNIFKIKVKSLKVGGRDRT